MASFTPPVKRGINASMLSPSTKKDSFDEMGSTYVSPDASMKINAKGVRGNDGSYLDTVAPQELVIKEELGRGASAIVKRAGRCGSSEEYVVKCFNIYDANKRRMLREEMKLLMAMSSPSIVSFLGAFLDNSQRICIILEFMDKGSLEDVVSFSRKHSVPIPENVLCSMTYQLVNGLQYLNSQGFMHRDIKPPNLLVNSKGQVKITDFGIGRRLADAHSGLSGLTEDDNDNDEEGDGMASTFVGTRVYMSVERLKGERYAASADVWSLGLVLCEAILEDHPLAQANESFATLIGSLQEIKPREDEEVSTLGVCLDNLTGLSDELKAFADWSLAIDPSVRAAPEDLLDDDWFTLHLGEGQSEKLLSDAAGLVGGWLRQGGMSDYMPIKEPEFIPEDTKDSSLECAMSLDSEAVEMGAGEAGAADGDMLQTIDSDED